MANGVLGKGLSSNGSPVIIYTVPASGVVFATISINLVNEHSAISTVKVAITTSSTPAAGDYIEFNTQLAANGGVLERTCMVCSPGENVIIEADSSLVAVRVHGLEKPTTGA